MPIEKITLPIYKIGTKQYELVLDYPAIQRFETATRPNETRKENLGIYELYEIIGQNRAPKMSDLVKLFWACARSKNPVWTLQMADDLFATSGVREYPRLLETLMQVITDGLTDPNAEPSEEPASPLASAAGSTASAG